MVGNLRKKKIRTAIFPVAGCGTRCYPATKVTPKELLTIVDKPLIHYAIEEAADAGIEQFILITTPKKKAIERYFDMNSEVSSSSRTRNETPVYFPKPKQMVSVRQFKPLGDGHAVLCARKFIGDDEPFAVLMPDDVILAQVPCLTQMIRAFTEIQGNLVATQTVLHRDTQRYGILDISHDDGHLVGIKGFVEKPEPALAPSTLAIAGRYIFQPKIFDALRVTPKGLGGEIQLTDAMIRLSQEQPFYGLRFEGVRYDCGNMMGLLQANLAFALARPDVAPALRTFLGNLDNISVRDSSTKGST